MYTCQCPMAEGGRQSHGRCQWGAEHLGPQEWGPRVPACWVSARLALGGLWWLTPEGSGFSENPREPARPAWIWGACPRPSEPWFLSLPVPAAGTAQSTEHTPFPGCPCSFLAPQPGPYWSSPSWPSAGFHHSAAQTWGPPGLCCKVGPLGFLQMVSCWPQP